MDDGARAERVSLYRRLCHQRGERCTAQRQIILEATLELGDHPSADQVFDRVRGAWPDIARPTVYRTLDHLALLGVITKACHPGRVTRFDTRVDCHHHLVCLRCNLLVDIEDEALDSLTLPDTSELDFEVVDFRVQLRGVCSACRNSHQREEQPP